MARAGFALLLLAGLLVVFGLLLPSLTGIAASEVPELVWVPVFGGAIVGALGGALLFASHVGHVGRSPRRRAPRTDPGTRRKGKGRRSRN